MFSCAGCSSRGPGDDRAQSLCVVLGDLFRSIHSCCCWVTVAWSPAVLEVVVAGLPPLERQTAPEALVILRPHRRKVKCRECGWTGRRVYLCGVQLRKIACPRCGRNSVFYEPPDRAVRKLRSIRPRRTRCPRCDRFSVWFYPRVPVEFDQPNFRRKLNPNPNRGDW